MGVKVYISRVSGNSEIRRKQEFVLSVLEGKNISFEAVDISDAANEADKIFMRDHGKPSGADKVTLAPQIFNDNVYCGGYDGFFEANENDELNSFLKISQ
jgi:glutaredoxin